MPITNSMQSMSIRRSDCTFDVNAKTSNLTTNIDAVASSQLYTAIELTEDFTLTSIDYLWYDFDCGSANYNVYLPSTATTGKLITIRNISSNIAGRVKVNNPLWDLNDNIPQGIQRKYIFDGTNWTAAEDRLIDFGKSGAYNKDKSDTTIQDFRANASYREGSFAIGEDAFTNKDGSYAIGKSAKATGQYSKAIGFESEATRTSEVGELAGIDANHRHLKKYVTWAGELIPVAQGYFEIYLHKIAGERFYVEPNSLITGTLYINGNEVAGGSGRRISRVYAIHISKAATEDTIELTTSQLSQVRYDPDFIINIDLIANTTTGNFEIWVQSGSIVAEFDTYWTAYFDFIETKF